ncbi:MAG: ZIP family metal transporter [Actinomycetota bacterium]
MAVTSPDTPAPSRRPLWMTVGAALLLALLVILAFKVFDSTVSLREPPPVESLAFERTVLEEGSIALHLRNDGPDQVAIAQVLVNDAYWNFEVGDPTLGRLDTTTLTIPYPWEEGLPVNIAVVTSTGVTIEHEIEAATLTPELDRSTFVTYALLGIYIGVIPVGIGLFAFPFLRRVPRRWLGFFLALTLGLLAFLLVDTTAEGLELAGETAAALDGIALFAMGALLAVAGLLWFEGWLERRKATGASKGSAPTAGLVLAYLVAAGIGLHNMGEGLAVGAALAAGEVALGTFLVLGFALHNTTEGLAIVAPLGGEADRPRLWHFAALGLIAGIPTVFGAWMGGFAFSPAAAAFAFGIAAGAIAQVIWTIARTMSGEAAMTRGLPTVGFLTGLVVMYGTSLVAA